jgi:hypothetical protein
MWSEPAIRDRHRIEELWRGRLIEARNKYELAASKSKTAGTDFTAGTLPMPDGSQNVNNTLRAETKARDEYLRILRIFIDLWYRARGLRKMSPSPPVWYAVDSN